MTRAPDAAPLTLEELASDWLRPDDEEHFSLPAITNFHGMVQATWGPTGVQNFICAPAGMATPSGLLFIRDGDRIRRFPRAGTEYRWKAYEIERRGGGVHSTLRMTAGRAGIMERLRFDKAMTVYLVFGGLPRVWRFTDYWNLPPEDVPQMNLRLLPASGDAPARFHLDDVKTFGFAEIAAPGTLRVYRDLHDWLDSGPTAETGRVGVAEIKVSAGQEIAWWSVLGYDPQPPIDGEQEWQRGPEAWRRVWNAAFTPGNSEFGGHLPNFAGDLRRLYYMAVLSLLMTRRLNPPATPRSSIATGGQCIWSESKEPLKRAYVWGGPEGAPTTSFLWEVEFQAPLLARLDPVVLRDQLEALMRVDLGKHWGVETISGAGAGMYYGVNPGAFLSCVSDYVRITGDREWALGHLDYLRRCARPELTDYGDCQNILECVSTYEHTIAAFNALNVAGLRFLADLTGEAEYKAQADRLAAKVLELYAGGPFFCRQPDGSTRIVKTILDFVYVGRFMTEYVPADVREGMVNYFREELMTEDWLYALSPRDPDALTPHLPKFQTYRADHQATGSYDGWPARAAAVLLRFGQREETLAWLKRLQELTREGPFGQAHFIHEVDGRRVTRKASFFNGNCYFESAAAGFATTLLEELR